MVFKHTQSVKMCRQAQASNASFGWPARKMRVGACTPSKRYDNKGLLIYSLQEGSGHFFLFPIWMAFDFPFLRVEVAGSVYLGATYGSIASAEKDSEVLFFKSEEMPVLVGLDVFLTRLCSFADFPIDSK